MKTPLNSTVVLRGGFAAILILLAASAVEAFNLQRSGGPQQSAAYQRFLLQDDAITSFRRTIWLGGIYTRDFFIAPNEAGRQRYNSRLQELERQGTDALNTLQSLTPRRLESLGLRTEFARFLAELRRAVSNPIAVSSPDSYLEAVLIPRRLSAFALAEELRASIRQELVDAQAQFVSARAAAAQTQVLLLGLALAIGFVVAAFSLRFAARAERDRQVHSEELEALSARLLEIQEEERRSLSRELHDEVGQTLTALRLEISHAISLLPAGPIADRLARSRELAENTVRTVRDISLLLRPSLLDDLGLGAALQWQLEDFSRRSGIRTELIGADVGENLSDSAKTCIFRIAQEALNNCEKYSQAKLVRVDLSHKNQALCLDVHDDGIGFALDHRGLPGRGTGILGIKERVQKLGGSFSLETRSGKGTHLRVQLLETIS
ncbi:MAG: sensor histidine kinase [Acidobacteria bacterium]|nr:sensor histidine kinase [Acidobacteriota bacterium]